MVKYPVRCRIIDATGKEFHGIPMRNPDEAVSHIGKTGTAYESSVGVTIQLDDGNIIHGYQCWWEPEE